VPDDAWPQRRLAEFLLIEDNEGDVLLALEALAAAKVCNTRFIDVVAPPAESALEARDAA
jgi:hypothetical protein